MILVAGGSKGGTGKSTIATNLVVMRSQAGRDVLLVDADDQETSADFTILRNSVREEGAGYTCVKLTGAAVRTELQRLAPKYDDIIVDAGGRDTVSQRAALVLADVLLIPVLPRSFDIWTLDAVATLTQEIRTVNPNLKAFVFINKGDSSGVYNVEARRMIEDKPEFEYVEAPIISRKAFGKAAEQGRAVTEIRPIDRKARDEITTLYNAIFE